MALDGAAELDRALRRLEVDINERREQHREAGDIVHQEARRTSFSRRGAATGRVSAQKRRAVVRFGNASTPWVGPGHFGHFNRPQGGFMRPNPFLYDAADARADEVVESYERFVDRVTRRLDLT